MKFTYAYKTSDGTRHLASIEAICRESVFEELRRVGIRPIKVVASDGIKENGEICGVRKRVVIVIAICVAVLSAVAAVFVLRYNEHTSFVLHESRRADYTGDVKEVQQYFEERDRLEREYRDRIEDRVKKGTLSREEADRILQTVFD